MNTSLVPIHDVDEIWFLVAERFAACLRKTPNNLTAGDYWSMCRNGEGFLIICHDEAIKSASVWRFEGDAFNCLLMAGDDADRWVPSLFEFAANIARTNGCTALKASGRIGLGHMLKRNSIKIRTTRQTYMVEV